MYEQLKDLMSNASFFYGPTSKEVAFSVPVQSWTTIIGGQWYVGTTVAVDGLAGIEIPAPPPPADGTIEGSVAEEQPASAA